MFEIEATHSFTRQIKQPNQTQKRGKDAVLFYICLDRKQQHPKPKSDISLFLVLGSLSTN
jgi:hypothetical protein